MPATLTHRDAAAYGDRPFDRLAPKAAHTVPYLMPEACDAATASFGAGQPRPSTIRPMASGVGQ